MPAKPVWFSHLDRILDELRSSPRPFVDRSTLEFLLGVGRRRAQQILAPCITDRVGTIEAHSSRQAAEREFTGDLPEASRSPL